MTAARTIWHLSRDGASDGRELVTTIPIRTKSEANARDHWAAKARRTKQQRHTVGLVVGAHLGLEGMGVPCVVTLVRLAPSCGLDDDNLVSSMKAVRDGVTDALGLKSDRDPRVVWRYEQRRSKPKVWAVEIRIVRGGTVAA